MANGVLSLRTSSKSGDHPQFRCVLCQVALYVDSSSGLGDMRMELKNDLILVRDFLQRALHVLAGVCHDCLLGLLIKILQCGSLGGVYIDFPGKEFFGLWKVRRD